MAIKMKLAINALLISIFLSGLFSTPISAGDAICTNVNGVKTCPVCSLDSNGVIDMTVRDGKHGSQAKCTIDNALTGITLYKLGLCRSLPDTTNPATDWDSKCDFIFDKVDGQFIETQIGKPFTIPDTDLNQEVLKEGSYSHYVLMIKNELTAKEKYTFSHRMQGRTSIGYVCFTVDGASYVKHDMNSLSMLSVDCVESEASVQGYGRSTMKNTYFGNSTRKINENGNNVYLMSDKTTLATIDADNHSSNANYMIGVVYPSSPSMLTPKTKNIDFAFLHKNAGQIEFDTNITGCTDITRNSQTEACIGAMRAFNFDFKVTFE